MKNMRPIYAKLLCGALILLLMAMSLKVWQMSRDNFDKYRGEIMHWFPSFQWALGPILICVGLIALYAAAKYAKPKFSVLAYTIFLILMSVSCIGLYPDSDTVPYSFECYHYAHSEFYKDDSDRLCAPMPKSYQRKFPNP